MLVGGWAIGLYGNPRATKDIDFFISNDRLNIVNFQSALSDFHAPPVDDHLFDTPGNVYRISFSPIQIDVISEATGVNFEDCYPRRESVVIDDVPISVISRKDLIVNKKASGRYRDLADVEFLEE